MKHHALVDASAGQALIGKPDVIILGQAVLDRRFRARASAGGRSRARWPPGSEGGLSALVAVGSRAPSPATAT
eukprot:1408619-Pyramimonas_sp.AAC.1